MRRVIPYSALFVVLACPGPPPPPREDACLQEPMQKVIRQWPTVGAALAADDVYGQAVWYWAHRQGNVQGFGAVLATIDHRPGLQGLPSDIEASGDAAEPSLLFFEPDDGPSDAWPVIGMGYFHHFDPCDRPKNTCGGPEDFFVHEAGYHLAPFGDGGYRAATLENLREGAVLDEEGCIDVHAEDLQVRFGEFRHGRNWTAHVWFPPASDPDATPIWAAEDPWGRWRNGGEPVTLIGTPFYAQGECDCVNAPPERVERRGCL